MKKVNITVKIKNIVLMGVLTLALTNLTGCGITASGSQAGGSVGVSHSVPTPFANINLGVSTSAW